MKKRQVLQLLSVAAFAVTSSILFTSCGKSDDNSAPTTPVVGNNGGQCSYYNNGICMPGATCPDGSIPDPAGNCNGFNPGYNPNYGGDGNIHGGIVSISQTPAGLHCEGPAQHS